MKSPVDFMWSILIATLETVRGAALREPVYENVIVKTYLLQACMPSKCVVSFIIKS